MAGAHRVKSESWITALRLSEVGKGFAARLLNNLSPRNRAFGYRRVVALIGIAPLAQVYRQTGA